MRRTIFAMGIAAFLAVPANAANFFDYPGGNFFNYGSGENFFNYGSGENFFGALPGGSESTSETAQRRRQQIRIPAIPQ